MREAGEALDSGIPFPDKKHSEMMPRSFMKGNEVDLLYQVAQHILPIEIKSGKTINSDFF